MDITYVGESVGSAAHVLAIGVVSGGEPGERRQVAVIICDALNLKRECTVIICVTV